MNLIIARFGNSLSYQLFIARRKQDQFTRLLADRTTGIRISIRRKAEAADLKRTYGATLRKAALIAASVIVGIYAFYPEYTPTVSMIPHSGRKVISVEDIPETHQYARAPAPPRPKMPLAVDGEEVPEDVTIESTELNLDTMPDLGALGPPGTPGPTGPPSDEPLDYSEIDYKPHPIRIVTPEYPDEARRKHLEGKVMVKVLVDKEGGVEKVEVMSGPEIFQEAALAAARQFRFRPGKQAGERRRVWMIMPIEFSLK